MCEAVVLTSTVFVRGRRMDAFHTGPVGQWVLGDAEPAVRAALRELLHGAPRTSAAFEQVGPGEYTLRDELYTQPTPSIFDGEPRVELVDRVRRCCVKLPLDEAALRMLNETLPRMNRGTRVETLRATLSTDGWNLVENLLATGMAAVAPYRAPGPRRGSRVTLVGHSCLLVETPSTRVLAALRTAMAHHPAGALAVLQPGGRVEWVRGSPLTVRCGELAPPGPVWPAHHFVTEAST